MDGKGVLCAQAIEFAVNIVKYFRWLTEHQKEYVMSKQLLKSGTSIGANIHEANYAISKADFISKMQISLKETSETEYWLLILKKTNLLPEEFLFLQSNCNDIKRMLISTLNTAKK